ncbi:AmmeMemoRadiSam system protein A [Candidatus Halobeggiatoa sp. HSG11]|nr:AmmeMemoRadiSam system protein A [Candidatus Halobeggiatoa sp. HSG11]
MPLDKKNHQTLLQIAKQSIQHGLDTNKLISTVLNDYVPELHKKTATFVTLEINNNLRGCIGTLLAIRPLAEDVAYNAHAAAFSDPRFPQLKQDEVAALDIHISLLSEPELMSFDSEEDLIQQLRPYVDGLILTDGVHKGTFLPSVWESLTQPSEFLRYLKQKAGLPPDYWSNKLTVERYTTEYIS